MLEPHELQLSFHEVALPLDRGPPSERLQRELEEVAQKAAALRDVLHRRQNFPLEKFPQKEVAALCDSLRMRGFAVAHVISGGVVARAIFFFPRQFYLSPCDLLPRERAALILRSLASQGVSKDESCGDLRR